MKNAKVKWTLRSVATAVLVICTGLSLRANEDDDWSQFRGPNVNGSVGAAMPTEWTGSKNVRWSLDLPGPGSSSPICVAGKVYLTCYTGYGTDIEADDQGDVSALKRHLICFDLQEGKELWRSTVDSQADEDPFTGFIKEHGYASSTPVCDGEHVYTFFGKSGVCAFGVNDGALKWQTNVGQESDPAKWGGGSSPIVFENLVIVNAGNEGRQLIALDKATGEEVWSVKNDSFGSCWSTPIVVDTGDRQELVVSMPDKVLAYNPKNGEELWSCKSPIERTVCASLVQHEGVVFAMGGRQGRCIAIRCGGSGDVSESHVVWQKPVSSSIGTPVVVEGKLVWLSRSVILCLDCATGEEVYKGRADVAQPQGQQRGPQGNYASPVAAGSNVFFLLRSGQTLVLDSKEQFSSVSVNMIDESQPMFNATPAFVDDQILIRSQAKLYCIAGK